MDMTVENQGIRRPDPHCCAGADRPEPVITTIIPTFRRPQLLKRAIESVLAQSYRNVKICVYDNASGDETEGVVAKYVRRDDRITYFKNSENIGAANNMAQGVEAVNTDFYSLLNDDDFLLPNFYENAIGEFQSHPQAGFVCAKTIVVDVMNKRLQFRNKDWQGGLYQPSNEIASKMYGSHFTQTGVLLRTSMRESIGPFEKSGDDRLYLVMAGASSPFVVLDAYGAVFAVHSQAYSVLTGLRQDNMASVHEALLSTVDRVMKLEMPADRKVHLLLLVFKSYGRTFDVRKLRQLRKGVHEDHGSGDAALPSRVTPYGLFAKAYEVTPRRLHPVLTCCIDAIRYLQRRKRSKAKGDWLALPENAYSFFHSDECEVSRFLSSIPELSIGTSGVRQDAHA